MVTSESKQGIKIQSASAQLQVITKEKKLNAQLTATGCIILQSLNHLHCLATKWNKNQRSIDGVPMMCILELILKFRTLKNSRKHAIEFFNQISNQIEFQNESEIKRCKQQVNLKLV